jgi:segregation and condensation protein B
MSLKAKLEAVIYAAEEPVTLAQLAALFVDEALEWKAEQDAAAAAARVQDEAPGETLPQLNEAFPYLELETVVEATSTETSSEIVSESSVTTADAVAGAATSEENGTITGNANAEIGDAAEVVTESTETGAVVAEAAPEGDLKDDSALAAEAKQQAKARDREVRTVIKKVLDELVVEYAADARGIEIREIAGGYRMATKPEFHDAVRSFVKSLKPPLKLSLPALETLAVIAYKQPVTAPEVNEIRGVDSSGVFGSLLSRKLITTAGRKPVVGRPILYKTTREFLLRFGLKDVSELPSMEEFEKMAASELEEPVAEEGTAAPDGAEEFNPDPSVEQDAAEAEELESNLAGSAEDGGAEPSSAAE